MKKAKKLVSLLLAVVMLLSLAVSGGAAPTGGESSTIDAEGHEDTGTITVKKAAKDETYKAYQIFWLDSYIAGTGKDELNNPTGGNYTYKMTNAWSGLLEFTDALTDGTKITDYIVKDENDYIKWVGEVNRTRGQKFAQLAIKYLETHPEIKPVAIGTPVEDTLVDGKQTYKVEFTGLKLGYYLIDTSLGNLCSLDTTNPNVIMEEKNTVPTNVKNVKEVNWGTENSAAIGSVIEFRSTITFTNGVNNLVLHDKMSNGLKLKVDTINVDNTVKVYKGEVGSSDLLADTNYNVIINDGTHSDIFKDACTDCTFHVVFTEDYLDSLTYTSATYVFNVAYNAELTKDAVIGNDGNKNTSKVSYGEENHFSTDSDTLTKTWQVPVFKFYFGGDNNTEEIGLKDAVFRLTSVTKEADKAETAITFVKVPNSSYKQTVDGVEKTITCDGYRVATEEEKSNDTVIKYTQITTNESGNFLLMGLDVGSYLLYEDVAPRPFNKLKEPVQIEIQANGQIKQKDSDASVIRVQNGTGTELPATGGIGTTIFYVVGSILLVGATILLIVKKRMNDEK